MKLTKDGQRVWDKLKAEGLSNTEIFEYVPVFPFEYESEEEKQKNMELMKKFRAEQDAKLTPEERIENKRISKELQERFLKENEDKKNEK